MLNFGRNVEIGWEIVGRCLRDGKVKSRDIAEIFGVHVTMVHVAAQYLVAAEIIKKTNGREAGMSLIKDGPTYLDVVVACLGPIDFSAKMHENAYYREVGKVAGMALADHLNQPIEAVEDDEEME